jgi:hypothetical protein
VEVTETHKYADFSSWEYGTTLVLTRIDTVVTINKLAKRGEPPLLEHFDTLGTEWVLNVGQEENAFHLPMYFNEGGSAPLVRKTYDMMRFIGLGARVAGFHSIGEFLRFDVGDGTFIELYMAAPELMTPQQHIERWHNKQGVWKW